MLFRTLLRRISLVIAALLLAVVLALWAVRTFWLTDLSVLAPKIESTLGAVFKQPVHMQGFRAHWGWTYINLHLDQLTVGTPQANAVAAQTLTVKGFDAQVAVLPLLAQSISLNQLSAQAIDVNVTHTQNVWRIAGVPLMGETDPQATQVLRAVLNASAIKVDALTVSVADDTGQYAPQAGASFVWSALQMQRTGLSHQFSAKSAALTDYGLAPFTLEGGFKADVLADIADPKTWRSGIATVSSQVLNLDALYPRIAKAAPYLALGTKLQQALNASGIAKLAEKPPLQATLSFDQGILGIALTTQPSGNKPDETNRFDISWQHFNQEASTIEINASTLNLGLLKYAEDVAPSYFANNKHLQGLAKQLNVSGTLSQLSLKAAVQRTAKDGFLIESLSLDGAFKDISAHAAQVHVTSSQQAHTVTPAFDNLSGSFKALHSLKMPDYLNIDVQLDSQNAWLELPHLFDEARLSAQSVKGDIVLQVPQHRPELIVSSKNLVVRNADAMLGIRGKYRTSLLAQSAAKPADTFDVQGSIEMYKLNQLARYIPSTVSKNVRTWIQHAFLAGQASKGSFTYASVPQANTAVQNPHLEIKAHISDASIRVAQDIPVITGIKGDFSLLGNDLAFKRVSGEVGGLEISLPTVRIDDLERPSVKLEGRIQGDAAQFVQTVVAIPQVNLAGFKPTIDGNISVAGQWEIPLNSKDTPTFSSTVALVAKRAVWFENTPPMTDIAVSIDVNQQGFKLGTSKATWLGGAMQASGSAKWPRVLAGEIIPKEQGEVKLTGSFDMAQLRELSTAKNILTTAQKNWLASLIKVATGVFDYQASLNSTPTGWDLQAQSDLSRLALNIPNVYSKPQGLAFLLKARAKQQNGLDIDIRAGDQFAVQLEHQSLKDGAQLRLLRGAVAMGADAVLAMPEDGMNVHVVLPRLDVDALGAYLGTLPWGATGGGEGFELQTRVALQVNQLTMVQRQFNNVVAGAARDGSGKTAGNWRANVTADGINGYITWQDAARRTASGTLTARLQALTVPASEVQSAASLLEVQPSQIPNVDIEVEQLIVGGKPLGFLKLKAQNNASENDGRGWTIESLSLRASDSQVNASGAWRKVAARSLVDLKIDAKTSDLGATLTRLGQANVVRAAAGTLNGNVAWQGTPFSIDLPSLTGTLIASLEKGQFLKVEPGAGRMLGVFSLQSIPRRLTLDFRDLFSSGFAFDSLQATAKLNAGELKTDDFLMQSAAASIKGSGTVNLVDETQNLHFMVRPDFNAGGVSLAYMLINPPLGLGTLLVQWLLREPLRTQLTVEYDVTGGWAAPVVKQSERSLQLKDK